MKLGTHPDINWTLQTPASSYGRGDQFNSDIYTDDAVLIEASPAPKLKLKRQLINLRIKLKEKETTCQISVKTDSLEWLLQILKDNAGRTIREIKNLEVSHKVNA